MPLCHSLYICRSTSHRSVVCYSSTTHYLIHAVTTDMENPVTEFLNELERAEETKEKLPVPNLMRRIVDLLGELLDNRDPDGDLLDAWSSTTTIVPVNGPVETQDGAEQSYELDDTADDGWPVIDEWTGAEPTKPPRTHGKLEEEWAGGLEILKLQSALESIAATETPVFVDVNFLRSKAGYAVKEFAAYSPGAKDVAWITVKTSPKLVLQNEENERFTETVHGLGWSVGLIEEDHLREIVHKTLGRDRSVYVKGWKKKYIVRTVLDMPCVELDERPRMRTLRVSYKSEPCKYHETKKWWLACSTQHVRAMVKFYSKNWDN